MGTHKGPGGLVGSQIGNKKSLKNKKMKYFSSDAPPWWHLWMREVWRNRWRPPHTPTHQQPPHRSTSYTKTKKDTNTCTQVFSKQIEIQIHANQPVTLNANTNINTEYTQINKLHQLEIQIQIHPNQTDIYKMSNNAHWQARQMPDGNCWILFIISWLYTNTDKYKYKYW